VIHSYNLPPSIQSLCLGNAEFKGTLNEAVEKVEKETIVEHLRLENGNITRASQSLGVTERILGLRIRKYRINPKEYKKS
ncbi:MAG TPA: helix-turn-helix domain-containing protein, partial [Spirochaetota bacterium]|nr:helix-turn-helix domain-containing protein [Spirochaetota bacterium]